MKKLFSLLLLTLLFPVMNVNAEAKDIIIRGDIVNGKVLCDKTSAEAGETVQLQIIPDNGYKLDVIKVLDIFDEMPVDVVNNSFVMPTYKVFISAEFVKDEGTSSSKQPETNPVEDEGTSSSKQPETNPVEQPNNNEQVDESNEPEYSIGEPDNSTVITSKLMSDDKNNTLELVLIGAGTLVVAGLLIYILVKKRD